MFAWFEKIIDPGLVEGAMPASEHLDSSFVDINAGDFVAGFREAGSGDQADIARAKDAYVHWGLRIQS